MTPYPKTMKRTSQRDFRRMASPKQTVLSSDTACDGHDDHGSRCRSCRQDDRFADFFRQIDDFSFHAAARTHAFFVCFVAAIAIAIGITFARVVATAALATAVLAIAAAVRGVFRVIFGGIVGRTRFTAAIILTAIFHFFTHDVTLFHSPQAVGALPHERHNTRNIIRRMRFDKRKGKNDLRAVRAPKMRVPPSRLFPVGA